MWLLKEAHGEISCKPADCKLQNKRAPVFRCQFLLRPDWQETLLTVNPTTSLQVYTTPPDAAGPRARALTFITAKRGWGSLCCEKRKRNDEESLNEEQERFDFWLEWAAQCEPEGRISLYLWKDCQVDWAGSRDERRTSGRRRRVLFLLFNPACRGVCGITLCVCVCVCVCGDRTMKQNQLAASTLSECEEDSAGPLHVRTTHWSTFINPDGSCRTSVRSHRSSPFTDSGPGPPDPPDCPHWATRTWSQIFTHSVITAGFWQSPVCWTGSARRPLTRCSRCSKCSRCFRCSRCFNKLWL